MTFFRTSCTLLVLVPEAPAALDPEVLCTRYAVPMLQLARWQQARSVIVDVVEGGKVIAVEATRD